MLSLLHLLSLLYTLRFEIADLLKLPASLKPEERDQLVKAWVEGKKCEEREHTNPGWAALGLKEWFVNQTLMLEITHEHSESSTLRKDAELKMKQVEDASSSGNNVKIEKPAWHEVQQLKKILQSAEKVVVGQLNVARLLLARLKLARVDTGLQMAFDTASNCVTKVVDLVVMADTLDRDADEQLKALKAEMQTEKDKADTIQDAMKLAIKKAKSKLE